MCGRDTHSTKELTVPGDPTAVWRAAANAEAEYVNAAVAQAQELARGGAVSTALQILHDGLQRARLLCAEGMPGAEALQMQWWEASLAIEEIYCPEP